MKYHVVTLAFLMVSCVFPVAFPVPRPVHGPCLVAPLAALRKRQLFGVAAVGGCGGAQRLQLRSATAFTLAGETPGTARL